MQGMQNDPNYVRRLEPKKIFLWFVRLFLAVGSVLFITPYVYMFCRAGQYLSFTETPLDMWLNLSVFPLWYLAHWKKWSWLLAGLMAVVFGALTAAWLLYFYQLHTTSLAILPIVILGMLAIARLPTRMDWIVTFPILFWALWCGYWDMNFNTRDTYLAPWDRVEISLSEGQLRLRPHGVIPYDNPFRFFSDPIELDTCQFSRRLPGRSDILHGECTSKGTLVEINVEDKYVTFKHHNLPRFQLINYSHCLSTGCYNSFSCKTETDFRFVSINEIEVNCDRPW